MAQITLTVDDSKVPIIIAALDAHYHDKPSGIGAAQWAKRCLKSHLIKIVKEHQERLAREGIIGAINAEVDAVDTAIT